MTLDSENRNMVTTTAAHLSDAGRMMRQGKAPSFTTIRGLIEGCHWMDRQRRMALERLNKAEGRVFELSGEDVAPTMHLRDVLSLFVGWLEHQGEMADLPRTDRSYDQLGQAFIESYRDAHPEGPQLPGLSPAKHTPEEELS